MTGGDIDVPVAAFSSEEEVPECAYFPEEYIGRYKRHIHELIQHMERLVEEVENFEAEGQKMVEWNGLQLATLSRDTVWHNLTALQDCNGMITDIIELFRQKIRESVGMVATNPDHFSNRQPMSPLHTEHSGLSEYSSEGGESEDEEFPEGFQDVTPVKSKKAARALNDEVIDRVKMQSIEWHEDLHEPTGVDSVFDLICPEGSTGIREFNKETLMDVLYYLSPRYGQLIVDTVTEQLNQKYHIFKEEHPGWDGKVSIFAHSLGSVITYDILTHKRGEVSSNGVRFPGLDFTVENFFAAGRYFNIFHPIDPIAYRVEPLIKQEMHDKPPVQLISAHSVRNLGFAKIQEMLERITGPIHGFPHRIDYVMKRRKREQGMMEFAYATASHSSYWMSEDVVLFTIMQICKPVVDKLHLKLGIT
ncbi:hypothetical protein ATCC90586_004299 [Pythium insidiosum]|nr:hypothetical protein ATCC90586_004299 [Pythium insidiosum]